MTIEFSELNLHPQILEAVTELGYKTPTPIQEAVIPTLLSGRDVIGQAQTGTGKTAAFSLPLLSKIEPGLGSVQGLILAPTRELAIQVANTIYKYGQKRGIRNLAIYGGESYGKQKSSLRRGVDIVVGTPGRMIDLIKQGALDLSEVHTVVLDEADEMLSMGFIEDIETILDEVPSDHQTALFSATMPRGIRSLANRYLKDPEIVSIKRESMTVSNIEQRLYTVNDRDKTAALSRLFEIEEINCSIIFAKTRVGTGELANELTQRGFPAEAISGDLSQEARMRVLNRFRNKQIKILVATDVAARGLDIDDISHVFNYDLPQDPEVFVHRVGRTGRAGRSGIAVTICTPRERGKIRRIEGYIKQELTVKTLPTIDEIKELREAQLMEKMTVWLNRGRSKRERAMLEQLLESGEFDAMDIAAAALKLARSEEKQRPIPEIGALREYNDRGGRNDRGRGRGRNDRRGGGRGRNDRGGDRRGGGRDRDRGGRGGDRRDRQGGGERQGGRRFESKSSHEDGMVRLVLSEGRDKGIRPNDIVGTIAYNADIPGRSIGAIRINDNSTTVDVPEQYVQKVLQNSGNYRVRDFSMDVKKAE